MKILGTSKKNGRVFIVGRGTYEEVESLNVAKDFETALNTLGKIRNTRRGFFDSKEPTRVKRTIHGRRKAS
jgi:hypothetical protein